MKERTGFKERIMIAYHRKEKHQLLQNVKITSLIFLATNIIIRTKNRGFMANGMNILEKNKRTIGFRSRLGTIDTMGY